MYQVRLAVFHSHLPPCRHLSDVSMSSYLCGQHSDSRSRASKSRTRNDCNLNSLIPSLLMQIGLQRQFLLYILGNSVSYLAGRPLRVFHSIFCTRVLLFIFRQRKSEGTAGTHSQIFSSFLYSGTQQDQNSTNEMRLEEISGGGGQQSGSPELRIDADAQRGLGTDGG